MSYLEKIYYNITEMVWNPPGERQFNPEFLKSISRKDRQSKEASKQRKAVKLAGKTSSKIADINVAPEVTNVADFNKRMARQFRALHYKAPVVSVPVTRATGPTKPKRRSGSTPRVLRPGESPRGAAGKRAGRAPGG